MTAKRFNAATAAALQLPDCFTTFPNDAARTHFNSRPESLNAPKRGCRLTL